MPTLLHKLEMLSTTTNKLFHFIKEKVGEMHLMHENDFLFLHQSSDEAMKDSS